MRAPDRPEQTGAAPGRRLSAGLARISLRSKQRAQATGLAMQSDHHVQKCRGHSMPGSSEGLRIRVLYRHRGVSRMQRVIAPPQADAQRRAPQWMRRVDRARRQTAEEHPGQRQLLQAQRGDAGQQQYTQARHCEPQHPAQRATHVDVSGGPFNWRPECANHAKRSSTAIGRIPRQQHPQFARTACTIPLNLHVEPARPRLIEMRADGWARAVLTQPRHFCEQPMRIADDDVRSVERRCPGLSQLESCPVPGRSST